MTDDFWVPGSQPDPPSGSPAPRGSDFGAPRPWGTTDGFPPPGARPQAGAMLGFPGPPDHETGFGARPSGTGGPASKGSSKLTAALFGLAAIVAVGVLFVVFVVGRQDSGAPSSRPGGEDDRTENSNDDESDAADETGTSDESTGSEDSPGAGDPSGSEDPSFSGVAFQPDSVAVDAASVWVTDAACGVVVRIDKRTEEVTGALAVGGSASGVAVAANSVWVGARDEDRVSRIDPDEFVVTAEIQLPGAALGMTAEGDDVWATDPFDGALYRIDAGTAQLVETVPVGLDPHDVTVVDGTAWVTNAGDDTVTMISADASPPVDVAVGAAPLHVEVGGGSVWVTNTLDGTVTRLDDRSGELEAVIEVGAWPHPLAYANGAVWVGTESGSFWRIDPTTNTATAVEGAAFSSIDTVVDGTDIWIADAFGGTVVRFDTVSGSVGSVVDLTEFGDCETFEGGFEPRPDPS